MPTEVPSSDLPSQVVPDSDLPQSQSNPVVTYVDDGTGHLVPNTSPAAKSAWSPLSGMSNYDVGMAGAGKSVVDIWHGVRQLFGVPGAQQDVDNAAARDAPLMHSIPGMIGYGAGTLASSVIPAGLAADAAKGLGLAGTASALGSLANPSTVGAAAASGALQGMVSPVETGGSRLWNTAAGGASGVAGNMLARGVSAASDTITNAIGSSANKAVQALTDAGVPLDAAQRTGSILLQRAKAMLSDNPLTAGAQQDFADMQQKAINKAFLSTVGVKGATAATPDVMGKAMQRLSNTYDDILTRVNVNYDDVEEPLERLLNTARTSLNDSQFGIVQRNVEDVMNKASQNGGVLSGEQFQNVKKTLDSIAKGSDSDVASFARDMRSVMNDGLYQSAINSGNTADASLLRQTNQQWRNMRTIENGISNDTKGNISPGLVANSLSNKANRSVSIYGQGDTALSDLADAANELLPNKVPNSGTPMRLAAQAALPLAAGGIEAVHSGDWKKGAELAALGYALPKAIQLGINSQDAIGKGAANAVAGFARSPELPTLAGGALQHLPLSALFGIQNNLDTKQKGQ